MVEGEGVAYKKTTTTMTMMSATLKVAEAMDVRIMTLFIGRNYVNIIHERTADTGLVHRIGFSEHNLRTGSR
eukprot:4719186-Ditylum_brightwellii.AAC.1